MFRSNIFGLFQDLPTDNGSNGEHSTEQDVVKTLVPNDDGLDKVCFLYKVFMHM